MTVTATPVTRRRPHWLAVVGMALLLTASAGCKPKYMKMSLFSQVVGIDLSGADAFLKMIEWRRSIAISMAAGFLTIRGNLTAPPRSQRGAAGKLSFVLEVDGQRCSMPR